MSYTHDEIVQIITQEANRLGVPVALALAIAGQESGLNAASIGDNGHSVGLFQLNDQGEGHGMTVAQREDPLTNARIALTQVANVMKSSPNMSWGQIAAAAQRPADRAGYAKAIDAATANSGGLSPEQAADNSPEGIAYRDQRNTSTPNSGPIDLKQFAADNGLPPQWLNDPQIGPLIDQFSSGAITYPQYLSSLHQTTLWRTTPQSARVAMADAAQDPATLHQTVAQLALQIHNQSRLSGITLTPQQEMNLAAQANSQGWNAQQITQNISTFFNGRGTQFGQVATDANTIRSMYKAYALPISDQTINSQIQQILAGTQTVAGIQSAAVQQAQTLYAGNPQLSKFISEDAGHTVADWAAPYMQHASTTLGMNPNAINLQDPMWMKVLNPVQDPNTGASLGQALTLDQWDKTLRTDPTYGFDHTDNAKQTASTFAQQLTQKMTGASVG